MTTSSLRAKDPANFAGALLLALILVSVFIMTHHPTLGSEGFDSLASEARSEFGLNALVHGGMIFITLGWYFCLTYLRDILGERSLCVRAGSLGLAVATFAMVGAALASGFVAPGVAEAFLYAGSDNAFRIQLNTISAFNQALAKLGTVGYGSAIAFWSMSLVQHKGFASITGLAGLVIGLAIAGGILTGMIRLDVRGMTMVVVIIGVWFAGVAVWMMRWRAR